MFVDSSKCSEKVHKVLPKLLYQIMDHYFYDHSMMESVTWNNASLAAVRITVILVPSTFSFLAPILEGMQRYGFL